MHFIYLTICFIIVAIIYLKYNAFSNEITSVFFGYETQQNFRKQKLFSKVLQYNVIFDVNSLEYEH